MKKIKVLAIIGAIMLLLSSCGSSASKLVGQWESDRGQISELEFFSDGTYTSDDPNHSGNYSVDGDRIRLQGILMSDLTYTFEINGNTLTFYKNSDDENPYAEYTKVN